MGLRLHLTIVGGLGLLGCVGPADDASRLASVLRERGSLNAPSRRATLSEEETSACLARARSLIAAARPFEAFEVLEKACDQGPSGSDATELRDLRSSLRRRIEMEELGLSGWISVREYDFEAGETARGRLVLENGGPHVVRLSAGVDAFPFGWFGRSESSRLLVEVRYLDHDPYGSEVGASWQESWELGDDIVLHPGQRWERDLELPIAPEPRFVVREYTVEARLLATIIEAGGQVHPAHGIEFAPSHFAAFLRGYRQVLDDPLAHLTQALGVLDPRTDLHVLVVSHLMPPQDISGAVELLIEKLRAAPPLRRRFAIMVALRELTGRKFALDEQRWLGWWRQLRDSTDDREGAAAEPLGRP